MTDRRRFVLFQVILLGAPLLVAALAWPAFAQAAPDAPAAAMSPDVMKWAFVSAALVTALSALGAAYAVAVVGAAAMGAIAEKPETAGRALIFVGLAEGIAIYGIIISVMILGYIG
ncbi:MAG TPA: ATP synthase subunit C [Vicinamibacterales bacterium]|nr:ATP synthase subunit C [Vicinamibacterales bacterium]